MPKLSNTRRIILKYCPQRNQKTKLIKGLAIILPELFIENEAFSYEKSNNLCESIFKETKR